MRIYPINIVYRVNNVPQRKLNTTNSTSPINHASECYACNAISFTGVQNGAVPLKRLVKYGIYDMYTGLRLLDPKYLEILMRKSTFNLPLEKIVPILKRQEDTMQPTAKNVLRLIEQHAVKNPRSNLSDALKSMLPEHEKKLYDSQQSIFDELTQYACDMPKDLFEEFKYLMFMTDKQMSHQKMKLPFSEKTLIYKLQRVKQEIATKNKRDEIRAINAIIKTAKVLFEPQIADSNTPRCRKTRLAERLAHQQKPEVLKQNLAKLRCLREIFENSALKNNKEILHILNDSSKRMRGSETLTSFKRKEFLYDLRKILKQLDNKELAAKMMKTAHKLPTSTENVSAFIVKYANDTPSRIGYFLLKEGVCSVDHLRAKNNGGKNKLSNFGLCSTYINTKKSNIPFDVWCRQHPETYANCQKYIDRMIELYNTGVFRTVGLKRNYITDFAETIKILSPKEKPLILNLEALN